jgi:hypothetical protein
MFQETVLKQQDAPEGDPINGKPASIENDRF